MQVTDLAAAHWFLVWLQTEIINKLIPVEIGDIL